MKKNFILMIIFALVFGLSGCDTEENTENIDNAGNTDKKGTIFVYAGAASSLEIANNSKGFTFSNTYIDESTEVTIVIKNTGSGGIKLTGIPYVNLDGATAVFSVSSALETSTINPGSSASFKIKFSPVNAVESYVYVSIPNNSENAPDFSFTVYGTGIRPKPIASVFYENNEILQNGTINAGKVVITQSEIISVVIKNTGREVLTLDTDNITISGADAAAFRKTTNPGGNISVGNQSSFIIECKPTEQGENNAVLVIPTNDNSRNPIVVYLRMTGYVPRSQITVKQGNTMINQHGEFNLGTVAIGDPKDITFTIGNSGDANLTFVTVDNNRINLGENNEVFFSVIQQPSSSTVVTPGNTTTFSIRFNPTTVGNGYMATVLIETNSRENDNFSFTVKGSSLLAAPVGVTAVFQPPSSILVSWNPVPGAASYKVYYGTSSSTITTLASSAVAGTSYTHTGLSAGTTYFYCITAQDNVSESARSQAVSMITLPGIPTNLRSTASTYNSITIAWGAVTGAASYRLYYATSAAGNKTLVSAVNSGTSYTHTGLSANTTYYYFVTAFNNSGEGTYTEALSVRTLLTPLSPPNNVTAAALSTNSIQVTWGAVTGAANYKVYRATSANGTRTLLDTVMTTSFTSGGLEGRTYWYFVTALNVDNVESALSAYASMVPKPNVPSNVYARWYGEATVIVAWSSVSGAENYRIYYATSLTGTKTLAGTTTSDTYWHDGAANTTYYYWVTAYNAAGESDYSLYTSAKTAPAAPMNLRATSVTTTSITLAWNAVAGASYYYINGVTPPTQTGTTITITGCTPRTWYCFSVRAFNSDGDGGPFTEDLWVQTN